MNKMTRGERRAYKARNKRNKIPQHGKRSLLVISALNRHSRKVGR